MSEALGAAAIGDSNTIDKMGVGGRLGNGESSAMEKISTVGVGGGTLAIGDVGSRSVAGVQTTPSVNGSMEVHQLKEQLAMKDDKIVELNDKLKEVHDNMLKVIIAGCGK